MILTSDSKELQAEVERLINVNEALMDTASEQREMIKKLSQVNIKLVNQVDGFTKENKELKQRLSEAKELF